MSDKKIRTMVTAAVLAALSCVATMVVQIPSPMNGFVNLGDCFVLLSGWLLGPWWGAAAGGIGSMLADLLLGYGHYAPGTLIIKGAMALVAALVFKAFRKNTAGALIGGVAAEVAAALGLLENIQRTDLNPFEQAQGLRDILVLWDCTQAEAAKRLGMAQPTLANKLRLLQLTGDQRQFVLDNNLTERCSRRIQARTLR